MDFNKTADLTVVGLLGIIAGSILSATVFGIWENYPPIMELLIERLSVSLIWISLGVLAYALLRGLYRGVKEIEEPK